MKNILNQDIIFKGKKVLLRVDLNVPMKNGSITETSRIKLTSRVNKKEYLDKIAQIQQDIQKGNIYEWDSQHGTLEKYNKRGKHQGEFDPKTGEQTKPKNKKREVEP